jgi:hypothetical protein
LQNLYPTSFNFPVEREQVLVVFHDMKRIWGKHLFPQFCWLYWWEVSDCTLLTFIFIYLQKLIDFLLYVKECSRYRMNKIYGLCFNYPEAYWKIPMTKQ